MGEGTHQVAGNGLVESSMGTVGRGLRPSASSCLLSNTWSPSAMTFTAVGPLASRALLMGCHPIRFGMGPSFLCRLAFFAAGRCFAYASPSSTKRSGPRALTVLAPLFTSASTITLPTFLVIWLLVESSTRLILLSSRIFSLSAVVLF